MNKLKRLTAFGLYLLVHPLLATLTTPQLHTLKAEKDYNALTTLFHDCHVDLNEGLINTLCSSLDQASDLFKKVSSGIYCCSSLQLGVVMASSCASLLEETEGLESERRLQEFQRGIGIGDAANYHENQSILMGFCLHLLAEDFDFSDETKEIVTRFGEELKKEQQNTSESLEMLNQSKRLTDETISRLQDSQREADSRLERMSDQAKKLKDNLKKIKGKVVQGKVASTMQKYYSLDSILSHYLYFCLWSLFIYYFYYRSAVFKSTDFRILPKETASRVFKSLLVTTLSHVVVEEGLVSLGSLDTLIPCWKVRVFLKSLIFVYLMNDIRGLMLENSRLNKLSSLHQLEDYLFDFQQQRQKTFNAHQSCRSTRSGNLKEDTGGAAASCTSMMPS